MNWSERKLMMAIAYGTLAWVVVALLSYGCTKARAETKLQTWERVTSWDTNDLINNVRFAQLVRTGRQFTGIQQLVHVNRAINFAIHPKVEADDYWAPPLETLTKASGDCEDYVIVKVAVFDALGLPAHLVLVRTPSGWHAMTAVEMDGETFYLDNRHNRITKVLPADHQIVWRMYKGKQHQ